MANKPRRIGTAGENYAVGKAAHWFPRVDRAKTNNPGNDLNDRFPVPVEIRRRDRWEPQKWARAQADKFPDGRWALWLLARDRRRVDAPPNIIAFPEDFALELLWYWYASQVLAREPYVTGVE